MLFTRNFCWILWVLLGCGAGNFAKAQTVQPVSINEANFTAKDVLKTAAVDSPRIVNSGLFLPWSYFGTKSYATVYSHLDAIATGDFNGDGRLDVALVTSFQSSLYQVTADDGALFIFYQNTQGALTEPVRYATAFVTRNRERSLAAGDLNGDGRTDLAIGNYDNLEIFTQTPQGTMQQSAVYRQANSFLAQAVKLGDVNGDGRTDVVSAGSQFNQIRLAVWLQTAQGQLAQPQFYSVPNSNGNEIEIGDLNGDGRKDVALLNASGIDFPDVLVFLQDASGQLQAPVSYNVDDLNCNGLAVGDVTGDNLDDLVVTFGGNRFNPPYPGVAVLAQNRNHTFDAPIKYDTLDIPQPAEVGDVNGDGRLDVVVVHYGWERVGVYLQGADGRLQTEDLYAIPYNPNGHNVQGLAVADINNDGQKDVLVTDNYQRKLLLLYRPTPGESAPTLTVTAPNGGESLTPGTTKQITWTANASVKRVRIEYSLDTINFLPIAAGVPNTGSYAWAVPDLGSSRAIIRLFDETGRVWDTNDEFFNIQSCRATLTTIRQVFEPTNGGSGIAILAVGTNCSWQAMTDASWLRFTMTRQGSGNAEITFDAEGGFGFGPQTGTITVGDAKLTIIRAGNFVSLSAAKYESPVSPESIVAGFGSKLATGTATANSTPLPTSLLGTTVKVKDSYGVERLAPLFFVSPGQINYLVPAGTALGEATVTVTSGDGSLSIDPVFVRGLAYGVFSANGSGSGPAAAYAVRVNGPAQTIVPTVRFDQTQRKWVNIPIDLSKPDEEVILVLHATGLRFRNPAIPARVVFFNENVVAEYAGPQGQLAGLDQINVRLPKSLIGAGEVGLIFFVDNTYANNVTISIQ